MVDIRDAVGALFLRADRVASIGVSEILKIGDRA
jgi:hypothetical protein